MEAQQGEDCRFWKEADAGLSLVSASYWLHEVTLSKPQLSHLHNGKNDATSLTGMLGVQGAHWAKERPKLFTPGSQDFSNVMVFTYCLPHFVTSQTKQYET